MVDNRYFVAPLILEQQRVTREGIESYEQGGMSGLKDFYARELYNLGAKTSIIGTAALFPGTFTQLARLPTAIRGGMTFGQVLRTYGGNLSPFPSLGMLALGGIHSHLTKSPGRAVADTSIGGSKREDSRVTISSRGAAAAAPQTLKPFWSDGKPKCRKGYRYDFKRKMCVKKS